jgi:AXL receptor tyrosine kinase
MSHVYAEAPESMPHVYVDVPEQPLEMSMMWDDDIFNSILETLISGKQLTIAEQIGEGNFGRVFKGTLDEKIIVAVKSLKSGTQGRVDSQTANSFVREALRMKNLDHPHVMGLVGICWATEVNFVSDDMNQLISVGPLILLPYTELGDLHDYLQEKRTKNGNFYIIYSNMSEDIADKDFPLDATELARFGYQIALGMDYVSRQGIVHRDLATRNCMLTSDANIKISDFGLARVLEEGKDYYRMGQSSAMPIRWMAPESITDFVFTTESDIVRGGNISQAVACTPCVK